MGRIQQKSLNGNHFAAFAVVVTAAALLVPTVVSAYGDSLFRTFQTFPQGQTAFGIRAGSAAEVATADFNGDGHPDVALSNRPNAIWGTNNVSIMLHQPPSPTDPMYVSNISLAVTGTDAGPVHIAVADINGDGKSDIATGNYSSTTGLPVSVSVIYGQGNAQFKNLRIKPVANYQGGLVVRDLNGDGRADVACLVGTGGSNKGVAVMYATTADSLANAVIYASSAGLSGFGIGDATSDGIPDLILTYPASVEVLIGDNAGNFDTGLASLPGASAPGAFMANMNGDGFLDLVQFDRTTYTAIIRMSLGFGSFQGPVTVSMGVAVQNFAYELITGDVDKDGDTELIGYASRAGDISIRRNNGAGSFSPAEHYADLPNAGVPVLLDANEDSWPDIVAGDAWGSPPSDPPSTAAVLLNDGSGGFVSSLHAITAYGGGGTLGDFNRDGKLDMAYQDNNAINIGFGNGNGTFTFHNAVSLMQNPLAMITADINRDAKLDLLVQLSSDVGIYLGAGDGTFTATQTLAGVNFGSYSKRCLADLNRDGRPDLILFGTSAQLKVYLQQADGTYGSSTTYTPSVGAYGVDFGDWNRDGRTDVAVAGPSGVSIFRGAITPGALVPEAVIGSGNYAGVCGMDANRDGMLDLAVSRPTNATAGINVFLGNGDGSFGAPTLMPTTALRPGPIDSWDTNRDGLVDLISRGLAGSDIVEVLRGGGNGLFGARTSYGLGFANGSAILGDLNGDAMPDVVAPTYDGVSDSTNIMTTLATPPTKPTTLQEVTSYSTISSAPFVAVGDLNRDGKLDAVVGSYASDPGIAVLLGNGNGALGASTTLTQSRYGGKVALADLNRDGILDIAALDNSVGSQRIATFMGVGDGTFGARIDYTIATGQDFEIGDMDRDGIPDIVVATPINVQVLHGIGNGTFAILSSVPLGGATVVDLDLADVDRDGDLDVVLAAGAAKVIYTFPGGTLGPVTNLPPPATDCQNVVIADLNRDGALDIIARDGTNYYEIWGPITGTPAYTTRTLSFGALDMKVGEAGADGKPYLYLTWNNQGLDVYSVSTTGVLTGIESHFVYASPYTMALADMDRDGQVDVVSVGQNFVTVNLHSASSTITAVDTPAPAPGAPRVALRQNYPNPFNPRTTIRYSLARAEHVRLRVFDVHGRLVATLRDGTEPAGERRVEWDGRDRGGQPVASGVYLYRLSTESGDDRSRRMVVVK